MSVSRAKIITLGHSAQKNSRIAYGKLIAAMAGGARLIRLRSRNVAVTFHEMFQKPTPVIGWRTLPCLPSTRRNPLSEEWTADQ